MKTVIAHGTFDIFHYGHLFYLQNAKGYGDKLCVLVSSDAYAKSRGKNPYFNENIRLTIINSLKVVDKAIIRNEKITDDYLKKLGCDIFVTTDPFLKEILKNTNVILLPRTEGISSSQIKEHLKMQEKL